MTVPYASPTSVQKRSHHRSRAAAARQRAQAEKRVARESEAVAWRTAGLTYTEIAEKMHCNPSTAQRYVMTGLDAAAAMREQDATLLRTLELERYDAMQRALWPRVLDGDDDAIDRAMRLSTLRTRLLGLDVNSIKLEIDEPAIAALAQIILRHVQDPRVIALIRSDFQAHMMAQRVSFPALGPGSDDVVEGQFSDAPDESQIP